MPQWVTVAEAADILNLTERTLRRHIQTNKRASKMVDATRYVLIADHEIEGQDHDPDHDPSIPDHDLDMIPIDALIKEKDRHIASLEKQLEELYERLRAAEESRQRSDAILMTLTQQLDRAHLQLEDFRQRRTVRKTSLWQRLKGVFASEPVEHKASL